LRLALLSLRAEDMAAGRTNKRKVDQGHEQPRSDERSHGKIQL
jgi:hypothetical protein